MFSSNALFPSCLAQPGKMHDERSKRWPPSKFTLTPSAMAISPDTNADPARVSRALALLPRLHALGVTKDGHPRHPLYVPADAPLIDWMP